MKKIILGFIIGLVVGMSTTVLAASILSNQIMYQPSDSTWNVSNVEEALDDLYKIYNSDSINAGKIYNYEYTGTGNNFVAPYTGKYKLEVWGASGGDTAFTTGGKGGYSYGEISLQKGTILYVYIGGAGTNGSSASIRYDGGYNGGGNSDPVNNKDCYNGSGGGATHIALDDGTLSSLASHATDGRILIVAGGGGGAASYVQNLSNDQGNGGAGGGISGITGTGGNASYGKGTGGSQTTGGTNSTSKIDGSFGQGGNGSLITAGWAGGAGGGGGYYGGGTGYTTTGAGGGSSYIGGVTNGNTVAGNAEILSPVGIVETGHSGNGFARITYLGK